MSPKCYLRTIRLVFFAVLILSAVKMNGQVTVVLTNGSKVSYSIGDIVALTVFVDAPQETCEDGLNRIKFLQSGIEILKQSSWKQLKKGYWQKDLSIRITGNKKQYGMLTIVRRTDKQSFTCQQHFDYSNHDYKKWTD